jgi:hypothetical protein
MNLYRFQANNPIALTDPEGMKPTKLTIRSVYEREAKTHKSVKLGKNGAFYWPVRFELNSESNPDKGGWIFQMISMTSTDQDGATVSPALQKITDYWEGFYVPPRWKRPHLYTLPPGVNIDLLNAGVGIISGVAASDVYYSSKPAAPGTFGNFGIWGIVWYIDCLGKGDLPKEFTIDPKGPAGNLPFLPLPKGEKIMDKLFKDHEDTTIGPYDHDIVVNWNDSTVKRGVPLRARKGTWVSVQEPND